METGKASMEIDTASRRPHYSPNHQPANSKGKKKEIDIQETQQQATCHNSTHTPSPPSIPNLNPQKQNTKQEIKQNP
jgi:hypothetical protein